MVSGSFLDHASAGESHPIPHPAADPPRPKEPGDGVPHPLCDPLSRNGQFALAVFQKSQFLTKVLFKRYTRDSQGMKAAKT